MARGTRVQEFEYKGHTIELKQPGWYCGSCGEAVFSGDDMAATEPEFMEFKARVDGVLTADEVRRIRTRLGLSQRRAGEVLGGGPRAFYKYEHGAVVVSRPMSHLLRLLDRDPSRIDELQAE
jgi:HTH-type transcriptional regulator/antitoxin MqsA